MQLLKANPAVKDEPLFNTIEEYILKYKLSMPTLVHTVIYCASAFVKAAFQTTHCNHL